MSSTVDEQNGLLRVRAVPKKPSEATIDPQRSVAGVFVLKFVEGSHVRLGASGLFVDAKTAISHPGEGERLARSGLDVTAASQELDQIRQVLDAYAERYGFAVGYAFRSEQFVYSVDDPKADEPFREKDELEQRAGEELADLDLYYVVFAKEFSDRKVQTALMNELLPFRIVEDAYPAAPAEPPRTPTPSLVDQQGYLGPAPAGLDAQYAWTRTGGRGDGVRLIDVEYDWVTDHEDFPPAPQLFWGGRPRCPYVAVGTEHGTAVMGIIAAPNNGLGIIGFAPNIQYGLSSACRPADYVWASLVGTFSGEQWPGRTHNVVVANSIDLAAGGLRPGDVLLVEQHSPGPATGRPCPPGGNCEQWEYVAVEYYQESFDVIRRATARGVIVVEAAGNGTQNLDSPTYRRRFSPNIRHSGALLVGASGAGDRRPNMSTNSSQRIDVHAWGAGVVTIGYGDGASPPFDRSNPINRLYTAGFSGTSSASAIVAGAVASLQGARRAAGRPPLTPVEMSRLLISSGTPQDGSQAEIEARPIGRQPNLRAATDVATASAGGFTGAGFYTIRSKWSGKVLDIDISWFRGQDDGQALLQVDFHGGRNQQFEVVGPADGPYWILPRHARGKALDVAHVATTDGAFLQQWRQHSGANQLLRIEPVGGFYRILATHSGKVLDVTAFSRDNGARIQQWTWLNGDNQLWEFHPNR